MIDSHALKNPKTTNDTPKSGTYAKIVMVGDDGYHSFKVEVNGEVLHDGGLVEQKPSAPATKAKATSKAKTSANGAATTKVTKGKGGKAVKAEVKDEDDDEDEPEDDDDEEDEPMIASDTPQTLAGLSMIVTGTLDSYSRKTAEEEITSHGGKYEKTMKPTLDYVVLGVKAGPKKLEEIENSNLKTLDEQQFKDMVANGPPGAKSKAKGASAANKGTKRAAPAAVEKKGAAAKKGKKA